MAHKKGGKQSLETASEKVQILELADKETRTLNQPFMFRDLEK